MEEFKKLLRIQDKCVKRMFHCIDINNNEGFIWYFEMWHDVTSDILHNKYNQVGDKLCDDILEYAYTYCREVFDIYYDAN